MRTACIILVWSSFEAILTATARSGYTPLTLWVDRLGKLTFKYDCPEPRWECATVDDNVSGYESDDETASITSVDSTKSDTTTWSTPTSVTDIQRHVPGPNIPHLGYLAAGVNLRQDLTARMVAMMFVAEELRWTWSRFNNIIDFLWFRRWVSGSFMERMRAICVPDNVADNKEGVSAD
jgi:hypothetical protein